MRVLIAEDERELADVLIPDRDMPGVHGDTVCRMLRAQDHPVPVLMLTAAAALDDRVAGPDLRADGPLPKPFAYLALLARLHALLPLGLTGCTSTDGSLPRPDGRTAAPTPASRSRARGSSSAMGPRSGRRICDGGGGFARTDLV